MVEIFGPPYHVPGDDTAVYMLRWHVVSFIAHHVVPPSNSLPNDLGMLSLLETRFCLVVPRRHVGYLLSTLILLMLSVSSFA